MTYADRISKAVIPPMSEAEIHQQSDQTISDIVGINASPRYIEAVKKAVLPLLNGYIEVRQISGGVGCAQLKHQANHHEFH